MRIEYVLFFHARKFDATTNLFLSLEKYILIDSYVDIKILTWEDTPRWQYIQCASFLILTMILIEDLFLMNMSSFKSGPSKRWSSPWFLDDDGNAFSFTFFFNMPQFVFIIYLSRGRVARGLLQGDDYGMFPRMLQVYNFLNERRFLRSSLKTSFFNMMMLSLSSWCLWDERSVLMIDALYNLLVVLALECPCLSWPSLSWHLSFDTMLRNLGEKT